MPVEKTNLTPTERALLADPNYVTEDEADFIICERRRRQGGRMIPLEQLHAHRYRIKFYSNRYRIIYDALGNQRTVRIFRVRSRKDAYRGL